LSPEILSSTCSCLLEWSTTIFFIWLKGLFISRISIWFFFVRFSHIFVQLLFHILCCLYYFIYLLFYSLLCFTLVFVEVLSEFIWLFLCLPKYFMCAVLIFLKCILYFLANCVL
jgi:hypothetical protein